MNQWIEKNIKELILICRKITKQENVDDVFQLCIEQLLKNKKVPTLPDNEKLYFFARIVRNNWSSNSSPYYHQYKKFNVQELGNIEIIEEEYNINEITMEWVNNKINEDKRTNNWYYARLFQIYVEEGCSIKNTSKRTTIPMNSVSRDINRYRNELRIARQIFINNN